MGPHRLIRSTPIYGGRYAALKEWSERFAQIHGRSPQLWLDKACIDRKDLDASLAYLPIYVSNAPVRAPKHARTL